MSEIEEATARFFMDRVVGKGGFGKAFWVLIRGTKVAVKCLIKEGSDVLKPKIEALTRYIQQCGILQCMLALIL